MTRIFQATTAPAEITGLVPPLAAGGEATPPGALGQQDSMASSAGPCIAALIANAGSSAASQPQAGNAAQALLRQCEAILGQLEQLGNGPLKALLALQPFQQLPHAITHLLPMLQALAARDIPLAEGMLSEVATWLAQARAQLAALERLRNTPWPSGLPEVPALQHLLDEVPRLLSPLRALVASAVSSAATAGIGDTPARDVTTPKAVDPVKQDIDELQAEIARARDLLKELVDTYGYPASEPIPETIEPLPMLAVIGKERARLEWHAERLAELLHEADDIESEMDGIEDRIQQQRGTGQDHALLRHLQARMQAVKEQIRILSAFVLQTGWLVGQLEKLAHLVTGQPPGDAPRLPASGGCA